jgi:TRAP-type transport system large permease protein
VSSAVIGIVIPPSIPMILFGVVTETSISRLFLGGLIPGLLIGVALMATTYVTAKKQHAGETQAFSIKTLGVATREAGFGLFLPVIVVGGILAGVFTATEAAVVAVFYALLVSMLIHRELRPKDLIGITVRTARLTGMVLFLLAMAMIVAWLLTTALVPQQLGQSAAELSTNPDVILGILSVLLLAVGVVMDLTPAILILAPIMTPIAATVGIDPVYFGVIMSFVLGIGLVTPPVGTVLYVGCAVGDVKMEGLVRKLLPFYGALLGVLALLIAFPQLVLWLPTNSG